MEMTLNPQKILRTGDMILDKVTGIIGKIHYIYEHSGQSTFECQVSKTESVQFDDGKGIKIIKIEELDSINKEKKCR